MIKVTTLSRLIEELDRAKAKHDWTGYTLDDMGNALTSELMELGDAESRGDIHGPHGMRAESLQAAVVLLRQYEALEGMADGHVPTQSDGLLNGTGGTGLVSAS